MSTITEPIPDGIDEPGPVIGTTTIFPILPEFDGKFINVPGEDLGQGTETYPIPDQGPLVNYNSGKSWPEKIAEIALIAVLASHIGVQIYKGDDLTDSKPYSFVIDLDPTTEQIKNPKDEELGPPDGPPSP